jgi:hypothetical protein
MPFFSRYYVDPSTISHSLSNSSSSGSTAIDPPPALTKPTLATGLIGTTLNSRVQQKQQQQQQQQQQTISVSRPGAGINNGNASNSNSTRCQLRNYKQKLRRGIAEKKK